MSHRGRLLVATPLIEDPNFLRTVVVLLEHDEDGAFGVVLNRPSLTPVAEPLPDWAGSAAAPAVMFLGGPVATDAVIGITAAPVGGGFDDGPGGCGFRTIDLSDRFVSDPSGSGLRLFVGAAGWSPGQLEDEIAEGAWWVVDARADDVVTDDPAGLWTRVVGRQRGPVRLFAHAPVDPTLN